MKEKDPINRTGKGHQPFTKSMISLIFQKPTSSHDRYIQNYDINEKDFFVHNKNIQC